MAHQNGGENHKEAALFVGTLGDEACFYQAGGTAGQWWFFTASDSLNRPLCIEDVITSNILETALSFWIICCQVC